MGRCGINDRISSLRSIREKSRSEQRCSPSTGRAKRADPAVADAIFNFFTACTLMPDGYSFWEDNLAAGQRGSDFLQSFCIEKSSKTFGAAESYWGNTPTSSAVVIANN